MNQRYFHACTSVGAIRTGSIKHDYYPGEGFKRDHLAHTVRIAEGSRLHAAFGTLEAQVNSMHHQGICELGAGLVPTAWSSDGLIEALESAREDHFLVGMQWHPEALIDTDPGTRRLFEEFIEAANQFHNAAALA